MLSGKVLNFFTVLRLLRTSTKAKRTFVNLSKPINLSRNIRYVIRRNMAAGGSTDVQKHKNRLSQERSPYLLQHASNPVDWYPWCEEAFEKAKREEKLIFLSVGYSTCHWCHVMERESFENEEIAKVMNENFVNIKVDREERPDVDKAYMTFVQATTGGGGWPMSVWLTPDLTPIYGGTYFPPDDRYYGRPGFKSVLTVISQQWKENKQKFTETGQKIIEAIKKSSILDKTTQVPSSDSSDKCMQQLSQHFEPKFGGFSEAPKFPQVVNLVFLFHLYASSPNSEKGKKALEMCLFTLKMMAKGGIHDHVSQGFARYSTDEKWHVPHFEKMLYDQAQLVQAYANAYVVTQEKFYANIVDDILTYVNRDLGHESGGFYSAEDADSYPTHDSKSKREGAFCVWAYEEIQSLLSEPIEGSDKIKLADIFCHHYDVKPEGNVNPYQDPHEELTKKNVLIVYGSEEGTAEHFNINLEKATEALQKCRNILYEARQKRPKPHLDDKMLTSWNGLMISGYARAAQALGNNDYLQRALKAANFVKTYLYDSATEMLYRSCYRDVDGSVVQISNPITGYLDDYAFLIKGLIDLYETCFDSAWLDWAELLQNQQDKLFWDEKGAGYFTSPSTEESVCLRLKEDQDGAEPSGNSVACSNLLRLAALLDRPELRDRAGQVFAAFSSRLTKVPIALPEMTSALMMYHDSPFQVFIAGKRDAETDALVRVVQERLIPGRVLAVVDTEDPKDTVARRNDTARHMKPVRGRAAAFVCRGNTCSLPATEPRQLADLLRA